MRGILFLRRSSNDFLLQDTFDFLRGTHLQISANICKVARLIASVFANTELVAKLTVVSGTENVSARKIVCGNFLEGRTFDN